MAESDRGQPHRRAEGVIRGSIRRFVEADGPSHSRAFAYHSMFVLLSGFIGVIGLAGTSPRTITIPAVAPTGR
jgi:hypothetical protein